MTTTWTITLPDGGTLTVTADEITTRTDGSLWLVQALDPKPAPLVPMLILAAGRWFSIEPWHD